MKRTVLICIAAAALALVACNKEKEIEDPNEGLVTVSMGANIELPTDGTDTKSTISDAGVFAWSAGDAVKVYSDASSFSQLDLNSGSGTASATFTGTIVGSAISTVAVFPASLNPALSGNNLTVTIPSEIAWVDGEADNLMVAKGFADGDSSVDFKNIGGIIKLTLNNVPATAAKVTVTAGKNISGDFTCDITDSEPVIVATDGSNGITFTFDALASATNMVFYVPVPTGTYPSLGFTVKDGSDATLWTFTASVSNTITRRKLLIMPPLTYVSMGGSGEGGSLTINTSTSFNGNVYLPKTSSDVVVNMAQTDGALNIEYADGATAEEKPGNVYLRKSDTGEIATLNINLASSHVELDGTGTIGSVTTLTNVSTLVVGEDITIGTVNLEQGNLEIAGTVTSIVVDEDATADGSSDPVEIVVAGTGSVAGITTSANLVVNSSSDADITITATADDLSITTDDEGGDGDIIISGVDPLRALFKNGGTYTLTDDAVLTEPLIATEDVEITLDLNGHTISYPDDAATTITGGIIQVKRGATLTIKDATATSSTVGNGQIIGGSKAYGAVQVTVKDDNADKTATLNVTGGTIKGYYYGIVGNGSRHNTAIKITKGTVQATAGPAIFHPQEGTLTVNGKYVTIAGVDAGIEMRAGTLTVASATVSATAELFKETANGSGSTIEGAAIAVSQHNTNRPLSVTLSSGTYTGIYAVYEKDLQDSNVEGISLALKGGTYNGDVYSQNCTKFVTGGTYQNDPTTLLADSYRIVPGTTYRVEKYVVNDNVTAIADIGSSFTTSGNYTLAADLTGRFAAGIVAGTDVTINLNNHSITSNSANGTFYLRGSMKLTINGEGQVIDTNAGGRNVWAASTTTNTCTVIINGGTFSSSNCESVYALGGTIYIYGGTFMSSCEDYRDDNGNHMYLLNCYDANRNNKDMNLNTGKAKILVYGGTFYNFNPADCAAEGEGTNFVATGYHVVESTVGDDRVYTVVAD